MTDQRLGIERAFRSLERAHPLLDCLDNLSIEGGFEDLDIMVLSPDVVLATAKFQETVTDRNGNQTVQHERAPSIATYGPYH